MRSKHLSSTEGAAHNVEQTPPLCGGHFRRAHVEKASGANACFHLRPAGSAGGFRHDKRRYGLIFSGPFLRLFHRRRCADRTSAALAGAVCGNRGAGRHYLWDRKTGSSIIRNRANNFKERRPETELVLLDGIGHMPYFPEPDRVAEFIRDMAGKGLEHADALANEGTQ